MWLCMMVTIDLSNFVKILNLTGFRKALKKFEKVTKIPAQAPYMREKVGAIFDGV